MRTAVPMGLVAIGLVACGSGILTPVAGPGDSSMAAPRVPVTVQTISAAGVAGTGVDSGIAPADDPALTTTPDQACQLGAVFGDFLAAHFAQSQHDYAHASRLLDSVLAADPHNPDLVNRAFILALSDGRMDAAVPLAADIVGRTPTAPLPGLTLLVDDARAGRWDGVRQRAEAQPTDGLNRFITALLRGWALAPAPGAGVSAAQPALAGLAPLGDSPAFVPVADLHRALVLDLAGDAGGAEAAYRKALGDNPNPPYRVIELAANFLARHGKVDEATALQASFAARNRESLDLAPIRANPAPLIASPKNGLAEALFDLASLLNQPDTGDLALVYARLALVLQPDFPLAQLVLADVLEGQQRSEEALTVYRAIDPKSPFSWGARLRAAALVNATGDNNAADAELKAMAAEHPDRSDPLIELGDTLRGRQRFAESADAYTAALARIPKPDARQWSIYYSRGIAYERSNQWPKAEADLKRALELQPTQPAVLNYLGYSWVERNQHLDEALKLIQRAVEARPNDGFIVDSLGWAYFRIGDAKKASAFLERAVELRPEDAAINDHLGDAYWQIGRDQEARFQWQRALSLNPDSDLQKAIEGKINHAPSRPAAPGAVVPAKAAPPAKRTQGG
ncbi:MAG TPA: tetratricopeptide repeat protein [Stellaceae bacterium]|nr:tetratricopeptide repeat protein [Stellaceae bacterium]